MANFESAKLSAPVGQSPRPNKGPEPKNTKPDVELVQQMLNAAGIKVAVNGKCDDKLVEAIKKFQVTVLHEKEPDGVVDVNQKAFKKLVEVAIKKGGDEADAAPEEQYYEFTYNGTTYLLTSADYKTAMDETASRLLRVAEALESQYQTLASVQEDMRKTIEGGEGLMQSVCFFASAKWAGLDVPEFANQPKAQAAVSQAKAGLKRGDIVNAPKLLTAAKEAVGAFDKELSAYRNKLIGGSESVVTALEFTRDTSFTVAEYIGAAVLVSRGVNPKVAKTSAAALAAALKSGATEYGEHMADPKKAWGDSAQKILVDTLVATATSIIANGFKGDSIKKWAGAVAPRIASSPPFKQIGTELSRKFIEKALSEGGQKLLKDGMTELIKTFGEMAKSGRPPTTAEVEKQITDYVTSELLGAVLKKFDGATWKVMRQLEDRFVDKNAKSLGDWFAKLGKAQRAKILQDIFKKYRDPIVKLAVGGAIDGLKPDSSEGEIVQTCVEQAVTDRQVLDILNKELEKQAKQRP